MFFTFGSVTKIASDGGLQVLVVEQEIDDLFGENDGLSDLYSDNRLQ